MSSPPLPDPDALSADGLKRLVARLLARVAALEEENRRLREENARLKDLPKRPKLASGGMDRATEPAGRAETRRRGRRDRGGKRTPPATEERVLTVAAPPGSRRKGYQPYTVQDLVLAPRVIRYRRERWVTPDGRELVAPLPPEVAGHFGPGIVRFALMQHVQGQVTTERLLAQLKALGVRIAKGHLVYVLNAAAAAYMLEHGASEAVIATLLAHERRSFADGADWSAHLAALGLGAGHRRLATEAALVGAIADRGLLTETVIVSDDAGQFDLLTHALCWVYAEL